MTINEAIWRDLSPFTIGFDNMFEQLSRVRQIPQTNYPPYNIRKGKSEDTFLIELAVAGFSEDDLTISVKENNLTVVGDISDKDRFKFQLDYLINNNVDLVDTSIIYIDEDDKFIRDYAKRLYNPEETLSHLFFYEINHETIMCKRSLIEKNKIQYYDRPAEDYCLFTRLAKKGMKSGHIEKPLVKVRERKDSLCGSNWENIKKDVDLMRIGLLGDIGLKPSDYDKKIHIALIDQDLSILSKYKFDDVLRWSNKIVDSNSLYKTYSVNYIKTQLYIRIIRLIKHIKRKTFFNLLRLKKSAVKYDKNISFKDLFYLYRY